MTISQEILDERLQGLEQPEDLPGDAGVIKELKIKLMERMPVAVPRDRDGSCAPELVKKGQPRIGGMDAGSPASTPPV